MGPDGGELWLNVTDTQGKPFRFTQPRAIIRTASTEETVAPMWAIKVKKDGKVRPGEAPFDTEMHDKVRAGGRLDAEMTHAMARIRLPEAIRNAEKFTLELPALVGGEPIKIDFVRKYAEYRQRVRELM
jgi:hypothetical protein